MQSTSPISGSLESSHSCFDENDGCQTGRIGLCNNHSKESQILSRYNDPEKHSYSKRGNRKMTRKDWKKVKPDSNRKNINPIAPCLAVGAHGGITWTPPGCSQCSLYLQSQFHSLPVGFLGIFQHHRVSILTWAPSSKLHKLTFQRLPPGNMALLHITQSHGIFSKILVGTSINSSTQLSYKISTVWVVPSSATRSRSSKVP